jgi:hypothetical protein
MNVRKDFLRAPCARYLDIRQRDIGPVKFDAKNVQMQCHKAVMRQPACPRQRIMTSLSRRFGSAQAFTVESGAIEAANASLPGGEHRAGIFDPARCYGILRIRFASAM